MSLSARTQTLCELDAKYGITIDVALLGFASAILFVKAVTEIPSFLTVLSTVTVLGLLLHLLVREFVPSYCPRPPPSVPVAPSASEPAARAAADPAAAVSQPAAVSQAAVASQAAAAALPLGAARQFSRPSSQANAFEFWKDTPGLQGRQVTKPRCGRGYSNYVPIPESS